MAAWRVVLLTPSACSWKNTPWNGKRLLLQLSDCCRAIDVLPACAYPPLCAPPADRTELERDSRELQVMARDSLG